MLVGRRLWPPKWCLGCAPRAHGTEPQLRSGFVGQESMGGEQCLGEDALAMLFADING